jgi:hypothetical protein
LRLSAATLTEDADSGDDALPAVPRVWLADAIRFAKGFIGKGITKNISVKSIYS